MQRPKPPPPALDAPLPADAPLVSTYGLESPQQLFVDVDSNGLLGLSADDRLPSGWFSLSKLWAFSGPGWLMSIAFLDPGNLEADLQLGAFQGYGLLWVLFLSTYVGLGFQLLAARIGVATRKHLAEHCRQHVPPGPRYALWAVTELAIVGSDIQEVIGCAIAITLLTGGAIALPGGVLLAAVSTFALLFLDTCGVRTLEGFFAILLAMLAAATAALFFAVAPDSYAVVDGLVPRRMSNGALQQALGMLGCVLMPHNLYLHSALVLSRQELKPRAGETRAAKLREALALFTVESFLALTMSFLINGAVVAVFAAGFFGSASAAQVGLLSAAKELSDLAGSEKMGVLWALGLFASGQSSAMTGTYAGQWVMQGYLNLNIVSWKRAVVTRGIAILPTLFVSVYFQGRDLDVLNQMINIAQSVVLPFALVPLVTFGSSRAVCGSLALSPAASAVAWLAAIVLVALNLTVVHAALATTFPPSVSWSFCGAYVAALLALFALCRDRQR